MEIGNKYVDTQKIGYKGSEELPTYEPPISYLQTDHRNHQNPRLLDANQPRERASFSSGFTTADRIHTVTLI